MFDWVLGDPMQDIRGRLGQLSAITFLRSVRRFYETPIGANITFRCAFPVEEANKKN